MKELINKYKSWIKEYEDQIEVLDKKTKVSVQLEHYAYNFAKKQGLIFTKQQISNVIMDLNRGDKNET